MGQLPLRVIANPSAGAGKVRRLLPILRESLSRLGLPYNIVLTQQRGDGTKLATQALADGVTLLAVMGGDGTTNEVIHAFVDEQGHPIAGPELALLPIGTGGDLRRTLGIPLELERSIAFLAKGQTKTIDLAALTVTDFDGRPSTRAFVNITSFGIGGVTDRLVNRTPKWLGGKASFYLGTLGALATYRNAPVRVTVDGAPFLEGHILNVALCNGRYFGGGMFIAPDASMSDGQLDVVALGDLSLAESIGLTSSIYKGTHLSHPKVRSTRGMLIEATPLDNRDVYIDMDGETPGKLPLTARCLPSALRVRVPLPVS